MSTQMLFYERVEAVNKDRHGDWCVESGGKHYEFARKVNSVPLTAVEMPLASREYTIVFAGAEEAVVPVVILGIQGDDNFYVTEAGGWDADYIPAFVRRYPFVFARSEDGKTFTLCIDESYAGCEPDGEGEHLFQKNGERTAYLDKVLNFLQDYQNHFRLTQAYCQRLREFDLLEPMQATVTVGEERHQLTGFMAVNRNKLKDLPAEKLSVLAQSDELELTYCHIQSMNNFSTMTKRAAQRSANE